MKRLISGLILGLLLLFTVWSTNPYFFVIFGVLVTGLALWEFFEMAEKVGCHCFRFLGYVAAATILYAFTINRLTFILPTLVALVMAMMIAVLFESKKPEDFSQILSSVAATLLGVFYVVVLSGFLIGVRVMKPAAQLPSSMLTLFFLIIVASDAGAYYVGKNLGKHKLAPIISPGKTVEGSLGGITAAIVVAVIARYSFVTQVPLWQIILLAVLMNIIGQMGDLFESLLKRGAGIKDAASIIPGHGGLLDRLDSIVFNAPLLYYYYLLFLVK